jgi:hypothetical protein
MAVAAKSEQKISYQAIKLFLIHNIMETKNLYRFTKRWEWVVVACILSVAIGPLDLAHPIHTNAGTHSDAGYRKCHLSPSGGYCINNGSVVPTAVTVHRRFGDSFRLHLQVDA